jgi:hypothetical protein
VLLLLLVATGAVIYFGSTLASGTDVPTSGHAAMAFGVIISLDGEQTCSCSIAESCVPAPALSGQLYSPPPPPACARAPQVGKQAQPGFYRFKLGAIETTVVSDGKLAFPAENRANCPLRKSR